MTLLSERGSIEKYPWSVNQFKEVWDGKSDAGGDVHLELSPAAGRSAKDASHCLFKVQPFHL